MGLHIKFVIYIFRPLKSRVHKNFENFNPTKIMTTKLEELFLDELKDIYDAEHQLTKALPKMAEAAQDSALKEAFEAHLSETQGHIERLEHVFAICQEDPQQKKCKAMAGLIAEGEELKKKGDAALIAAAQKVEHYEMATYGTLIAWAKHLNKTEAVELLRETYEEEKSADEKLTGIAEECANEQARAETSK